MTWYDDTNFGGANTEIRGDDGPCDWSGYGITDVDSWASSWSTRISSFKTWKPLHLYGRIYQHELWWFAGHVDRLLGRICRGHP